MRRTLINAASVLTGEFFVRLINFSVPILVARTYDSSALGRYSFGIACAALAALLPDMGLHLLTTREIASHPEKLREYFWNGLGLKVLLASATSALVLSLAWIFVTHSETRWIILILTLRLLLQSFSTFSMAIIRAFEQMHYLALLQMANVSLVALGFAWGIFQSLPLPLLLCAFLPGVLCEATLGTFLVFKKFGPLSPTWPCWKAMRSIAASAIPIGLTTLVITLNIRLDVIVLSWFRPAAEVGLFSAANVLSSGFFLLASLVMSIIFPKLSKLAAESRLDFRCYVETLLKVSLFFLVPISMSFFFGATLIIRLLYGLHYEGSVPVLKILAFSLPLIFLNAVFFFAFVARGKRSFYLWVMASGITVNILLNPLFTWKLGIEGTAFSNLLRETCQLVLFIGLSLTEKSLFFSARIFARSGISLALHTLFGLGMLHLGFGPLQILLAVLTIYFALMLVSKNFPKKTEMLLLAR